MSTSFGVLFLTEILYKYVRCRKIQILCTGRFSHFCINYIVTHLFTSSWKILGTRANFYGTRVVLFLINVILADYICEVFLSNDASSFIVMVILATVVYFKTQVTVYGTLSRSTCIYINNFSQGIFFDGLQNHLFVFQDEKRLNLKCLYLYSDFHSPW